MTRPRGPRFNGFPNGFSHEISGGKGKSTGKPGFSDERWKKHRFLFLIGKTPGSCSMAMLYKFL
jgi:hypothetical protein